MFPTIKMKITNSSNFGENTCSPKQNVDQTDETLQYMSHARVDASNMLNGARACLRIVDHIFANARLPVLGLNPQ
jgi:hypothetical protein